jgi:soluble lytic murein transglycosylase-like protein
MQLMPDTARRFDVADPFNPIANLHGGARYLRLLLDRFDNDVKLALAAYNAGESAVADHGRKVPPYEETRTYVSRVLKLYAAYGD